MISLLSILMVSGTAMGQSQMIGTKHDLSTTGPQAGPSTEICIYCHTPHGAQTPQIVPLWNRETTASVFTMYSSTTFNANAPAQPTGTSLGCLSCHDGTIAPNEYLSGPGFGTSDLTVISLSAGANLGSDLSNDHPVSFDYQSSITNGDAGLVAVSGSNVGALPLFGGNVECASCHNVHDDTNPFFLRINNSVQSALCVNCHTK